MWGIIVVVQIGIVSDVSIGQFVCIHIQLGLEGQFVMGFVSVLVALDMAEGGLVFFIMIAFMTVSTGV